MSGTTHSPITRQWILQPRPKPGRKPALDTPPTKRKAQNREAQRAFRERRAQRVGELEEHIKQEQSAFQHKHTQWEQMERTLVGNINGWRERADFWETRARGVEGQLAQLQEVNAQLRDEVGRLQNMWTAQSHAPTLPSISSLTDVAPLAALSTDELPESCKSCGDGENCACLDAVMEGISTDIKEEDDQPMEIDFTTKRTGTNMAEPIIIDSTIMEEGCGFCSKPGGASCPCREAANADSAINTQQDTAVTSPPSTTKSNTTSIRLEEPTSSRVPQSGPGSCSACQADPERRRFCQTLAGLMPPPARPDAPINPTKNKNTSSSASDAIKTQRFEAALPPTSSVDTDVSLPAMQLSAAPNARISCADAYTYFKQLPPGARDRHEFVQQLRAQPAQRTQSTPSSFSGVLNTVTSNHCSPAILDANNISEHGSCGGTGGLKCTTCNDVGCAPLEVDAASVLTAMRMGLAADTRFAAANVMRRESSMYADEGSE